MCCLLFQYVLGHDAIGHNLPVVCATLLAHHHRPNDGNKGTVNLISRDLRDMHYFKETLVNNNNNKDILCTNILEDQAQWCDKTIRLSNLIIV